MLYLRLILSLKQPIDSQDVALKIIDRILVYFSTDYLIHFI